MATYSDDFNRADETPLASGTWGQSGTGTFNLTSNQVVETGTGNDHEVYYVSAGAVGDQFSQAKITTIGTSEQGTGVVCRHIGSATRTFIRAIAEAGGPITVRVYTAGANVLVGTRTGAFTTNDVLRMEVTGTSPNIVIRVFKNGGQVGADFTGVTGPNTGKPGLCYSSTFATAVDDWSGGDLVATAPPAFRPITPALKFYRPGFSPLPMSFPQPDWTIPVAAPQVDLPPPPTSIDRADQRGRYRIPESIVLVGPLGFTQVVGVSPPAPLFVPREDRSRRPTGGGQISVGYPFIEEAPPTATPPPPVVTPVEPLVEDSVWAGSSRGFVDPTPPWPPFVVPLNERPRQTKGDVDISVGYPVDTTQPPRPLFVPSEDRSRRPIGSNDISVGYPAAVPTEGPPPPGPFVVPIEERRYILERLRQPTSSHGFLGNTPANGVLPPPPLNMDRADQRIRFLPQPSLVLSGVLIPFVPPPPVTVNAGTDWAAEMSTF